MEKLDVVKSIEESFRKQVRKDKNLKSACLLVHSEKHNIHLNANEGLVDPNQPVYMASVGKLFTSTLISILFEHGHLTFDDAITSYLDYPFMEALHVHDGNDYTDEIKIRHLLNHTSGLSDNFRPLLEKFLQDKNFYITPEEAIAWSKHHHAEFPPGKGFQYTDTNYHILGLIIEKITKLPFHEAVTQYIYEPLGMMHSSILYYSEPLDETTHPVADFYIENNKVTNYKGYAAIDYAGGAVVSTGEDLLKFMQALTNHRLVKEETLEKMKQDKVKYGMGIDYGYGMMQFKPVPLLMPKIFAMWGHAGATGAYMFYHPTFDAYIIGTFNDFSYEKKGVKFVLMKVITQLAKIK
ncbi:serine hydrolase domain-containing protein [Evansella cellulosilytica]|uniref:Beta-lactamase n=1 Tax=Evansella cellulosilytica (strain ATCC 21833 / DSM 2522 / FERM P-1141 / JCM 9156 / N-4) TaxID=649639 RepID=E6TVR3_EVAC2|nr:serine hydrolase domain-containing protein [Evansella cellulosilytica]ADU32191.1 beta-lactamase [Evansella cellulosilytica DSM 2522]